MGEPLSYGSGQPIVPPLAVGEPHRGRELGGLLVLGDRGEYAAA
jgi:hypothetical protein